MHSDVQYFLLLLESLYQAVSFFMVLKDSHMEESFH